MRRLELKLAVSIPPLLYIVVVLSLSFIREMAHCSNFDDFEIHRPTEGHGKLRRGLISETYAYTAYYLFSSLAFLDPRVGHTVDVLSPFISVLCHSD